MKQQLIALALSTALLAGSAAAIAPEEAFPAVNTYPGFADVAGSAWYATTVQTCYEVGLMTGTGAGFAPDQVLTVGEVVAIAARMNEAITGDSIYLVDSTLPWYASYVDYLEKLGVEVPAPVKQATRQEFITMLAAVVPEDMLTPINQITALPDTADAAVLSFYNAGILTGVDDWGTFALSTALLAGSAAAIAPEEAFPAVNTYPGFADVAGSAWYATTVQTCYEVGLMTGTGAGFAPDQVLTVGEVVAIAARMNEAITGDSIYLVDSTLPWYASYVDYLEKLGVEVPAPVKQATRQEFITMLAAVVPEDMLTPINQITALPDTADAAVLSFYNAGILTGVDDWGTFAPDKTLTRAETAAMVARVARPELRESFSPADYAMFTAAYLKPADVLFTNGVTAGQYLPYVQALIDGLEADCAAQGMEFNWFNTVDGVTFLDYVEDTALAHFGVTAKDGTQLYKDFDVQVYYSRYLDQKG